MDHASEVREDIMDDRTSDSPIVKKSDYLLGVKYWALWFPPERVPHYEVFVYFGTQIDTGLHWFHARNNPKIFVSRNIYQLNTHGFYPFVLDFRKIDEYCQSRGYKSPNGEL